MTKANEIIEMIRNEIHDDEYETSAEYWSAVRDALEDGQALESLGISDDDIEAVEEAHEIAKEMIEKDDSDVAVFLVDERDGEIIETTRGDVRKELGLDADEDWNSDRTITAIDNSIYQDFSSREDATKWIDEVLLEENFDSIVALMEDDIREEIHAKLAPCSKAEFLRAYEKAHLERFGEPFVY